MTEYEMILERRTRALLAVDAARDAVLRSRPHAAGRLAAAHAALEAMNALAEDARKAITP